MKLVLYNTSVAAIIFGGVSVYMGHLLGHIWPRFMGGIVFTLGVFLAGISFHIMLETRNKRKRNNG